MCHCHYILRCTLMLIGCGLLLSNVTAEEFTWPQFRGPHGSGVAADGNQPPVEFGLEQHCLWSADAVGGHSSPSIWGDRIYVTNFDADSNALSVVCVSRTSGREIWRRPVEAKKIERVHSISSPATATVATDGRHVVAYFASTGLHCFDVDGQPLWSVTTAVPDTPFGCGTSPIILRDLVILSRDEPADPYLLAVHVANGETAWKQPMPAGLLSMALSYSTPVVWGDDLVLHRMGEVVGFSHTDGARRWWYSLPTSGTSTPTVSGEQLIVAAWTNFGEPELRVALPGFGDLLEKHDSDDDGRLSQSEFPDDLAVARRPEVADDVPGAQVYFKPFFDRLDINKDGKLTTLEWAGVRLLVGAMHRDHGLVAIDGKGTREGDLSASQQWRETRAIPEVPSPLVYQGRVYVVKDGGIVSCLEANTGQLVYRERLGGPGPYYASPIAAGGRLYLASAQGMVTVIAAGDKAQVLARNHLQAPIFATPAVVDNTLYVRTADALHAFAASR